MTKFQHLDDDAGALLPAAAHAFRSPLPTRIVASDEFAPPPQSRAQREVEAHIRELAAVIAPRQGLSRRRFLASGCGMAAAFLAMNAVHGPWFEVAAAEAEDSDASAARATALADQFIFDDHTHFLRADAGPDSPLRRFVNIREAFARSGKNPDLEVGSQTYDDLMYETYVKEVFFDSDTKVAVLSGAPADNPAYWFLTNAMKAEARRRVNALAGAPRQMYQAVFMPGAPGWLDELDRTIEELRPDSWKGYTIGDNVEKATARHPWRLDDEKTVYPGYERMVKAGIRNVCIHKGLFSAEAARRWPGLLAHADVDDVARAARDWPDLNFVIYHSGMRSIGAAIDASVEQFESTGRIDWLSDLAEIPERHGVTNVYGDLGQVFANAAISHPRRHARHPDPRARGRSCGLGHGRPLAGLAAMADRGVPTARNPGRDATRIRLRAARPGRRAGQTGHSGPEQRAPLRSRCRGALGRPRRRRLLPVQGRVCGGRRGALQHGLWLHPRRRVIRPPAGPVRSASRRSPARGRASRSAARRGSPPRPTAGCRPIARR